MFEKAVALQPENPKIQSYLGYCIAYERGKIKDAINLCERALQADSQSSENYLNLGKVYFRAGLKMKAIETFRRGLGLDNQNAEIMLELESLGLRQKPVISFLPRGHSLNKYLGIIFSRLGFR